MSNLLNMITPVILENNLTITGVELNFTESFFTSNVSSVQLGENDFLHCRDDGTFVRTIFYAPETWILMSNKTITANMDNSFNVR